MLCYVRLFKTTTNRLFTNDDWQRGRFENFESDHHYESNLESDVQFEIESNHEASQVPRLCRNICHSSWIKQPIIYWVRGADTPKSIATNFCTSGAVHDIITQANFGEDRLRVWRGEGSNCDLFRGVVAITTLALYGAIVRRSGSIFQRGGGRTKVKNEVLSCNTIRSFS